MKYLFLILALISTFFCWSEEYPEISIRNKFRNLGDVQAGTILKEKYYLKNNTDSTIHIIRVNPECSCTSFKVSSYKILPKDSVYVELTLDTIHKRGIQTVYTIIKTSSKISMYRLALKANIHSTNKDL